MAFRLFCPLWSILPPSDCRVSRVKGKKDKEQIHHYYLSCVWTQKGGLPLSQPFAGPSFYFSLYCTGYRQYLLYRLLCYSIICELFITLAPYWWTGVAPYQQRIRYSYRSTPLIPIYPVVLPRYSSDVSCWQADTSSLSCTFFVYSIIPQGCKHQTSISSLTSLLHMCYICLLTPWALDTTQICVHMFSKPLQPPLDWL